MYNKVQHRMAQRAGDLDVQHGKITAMLAGGQAATKPNQKTAEDLRRYCRTKLPHQRFAERITIPNCPTALRMESVYSIDLLPIPINKRHGR
jgi:hypothetical protein